GTWPGITALAGGGFELAYVSAADNLLWETGPDGAARRAANGLGVAAGTSPAVAADGGGAFELAFHADGLNDLWTVDPANTGHETGLALADGTSPAISGLAAGDFEIAYHTPGGNLATLIPGGVPRDTGVAMASGTSPALSATPPAATPTTGPATVTVPNVQGMDDNGAQTTLTTAGLTAGQISLDSHCRDIAGTVLIQNPTAGIT